MRTILGGCANRASLLTIPYTSPDASDGHQLVVLMRSQGTHTNINNERSLAQSAIAILPSRVTNTQKSNGRFLDLADPLITKLSTIKQIIVRPTTASRVFDTPYDAASVGFALGVDYVLESQVRRKGAKSCASAQLGFCCENYFEARKPCESISLSGELEEALDELRLAHRILTV